MRHSYCRLFAFLCMMLIAVVGESASAQDTVREISFETADGGRIFANLYGDGEHAVVLAHGAVFNKESWDALAKRLVEEGYRALAIDFRGYGKSTPGTEQNALFQDVLAGVKFLHEAGAQRVSVLGGSMGGGAAATAVTQATEGQIDRLILLAAVPVAAPERIKGNKLFIVAQGDRLRSRVEAQFAAAPEPKQLVVMEGDAHAQHIFATELGDELTRRIVDFLAESKVGAE